MKMAARSGALLVISGWCVFAQQSTGGVQGNLNDDKGQPVGGAYIIATPRGGGGGLTVTAPAGPNGEFSLTGLKPGTYSVCVQVPGDSHLDPCTWSTAPLVTIAAGQNAAIVIPPVVKGSLFVLRIEDPSKVWAAKDDLLVGITLPTSGFRPLRLAGGDATGKTYDIAVPFDAPLVLSVSSSHLLFADDKGKSLGHTVTIPFKHVTGGNNARLTLTVTGRT